MNETLRFDRLDEESAVLVRGLFKQLDQKRGRNLLRTGYYDAHRTPLDLGVTLPPALVQRIGAVLGWPAKAVDALVQRCYWQGVAIPSDSGLQDLAGALVEANRLESELPQAFTSAFEHGVSFLVTTKGADGEPDAVITAKDALNGTGEWDLRRRALSSFLSVTARDDKNKPTDMVLYKPDRVTELKRADKSETLWTVTNRSVNTLGDVPAELVTYKPRLGRPFGCSRISRPVMSITDMAVRTVIRSEVNAEFYAVPQRWLMGADESAFGLEAGRGGDTWKILVGRIMALADRDDAPNGVDPRAQVGQFPQASQQPHMDQLRSLAQLFAGETSIPVSSLGISIDSNPTSADSYAASREDIIGEAEGVIRDNRGAISRTIRRAMRLAGTEPGDAQVLSKFRDPRYTSRAAASDAFMKAASVMPWLAESDVAVEVLGFDEVTAQRLLVDKRRATGGARLARLVEGMAGGVEG